MPSIFLNKLGRVYNLNPPPLRSGGGSGLPLKKANAFFKGTRGGGVRNRVATAFNTNCKQPLGRVDN